MAAPRGVPALLQPYLSLPAGVSAILLTGVLGAGTNWLLERYVIATLAADAVSDRAGLARESPADGGSESDAGVVLVSWMRDFESWRTEIRRASGLDLNKLIQQRRFAFVDGLTGIFVPSGGPPPRAPASRPKIGHYVLSSPDVQALEDAVASAVHALRDSQPTRRVLLILDQPDLVLALSSEAGQLGTARLIATLTAISRTVNTMVVAVGVDTPLVAPAAAALGQSRHAGDDGAMGTVPPPPAFAPLELRHAMLVTELAHQACWVIQLRKLDTGWARDVSGVVRISRGGGWVDEEDAASIGEGEVLYHVKGDGTVKVFERGAGSIV